ncbi:MAG: helix-turn-helix transcriptional regulator [Acidimicrobiia bacterium]|nr:helix-turn-helix transcriptional regulator [Acidimicrobiia bacterium]
MSKETRRAVFVISVAAELAGMHPQTLRIYERKGLIEPFRTSGGTRRYSQEDIDRLNQIQELTEQGLNLEGVKQVIEYQDKIARLEKRVASLEAKLEQMQVDAERRVNEVRRSYRHEIVLRSAMLPDLQRDE